jgi:MYXO-CTERM domain-containing protein
MAQFGWMAARIRLFLIVGVLFVIAAHARVACAQGNVLMGLDGNFVNNIGANYGTFNFSNTVGAAPDVGKYGAFTLTEPGAGGSGVGLNYTMLYENGVSAINTPVDSGQQISPVTADMFPLIDRGTFGTNFDPTQYVIDLTYKPVLTGAAPDTATQLNVTLDTSDGYIAGQRAGEQWQWGFTDLLNKYSGGTKDANGFVTVQNNGGSMSQAASFFHGQSFMYSVGNPTGDNLPDFTSFDGDPIKVPNGAAQFALQTTFGTTATDPTQRATAVDNWEVKSVVIRKINPSPTEVARLDSHSGLSVRFGAPFNTDGSAVTVDGTPYFPSNTDQVSRFDQNGFTPLTIKTSTDSATGGIALWQPANYVVFNGTNAKVEIMAKLTVPQGAGQADHIVLVLKDQDGNDDTPTTGADEYHFNLPLSSFNTSTMTTVSVPLNSFTKLTKANEFTNPGDGLLTNFNLYYLGINTDQGAGLVNLAIDHMSVMLPAPAGVAGDYNNDGVVDAADYAVWRANLGTTFALPNRDTTNSGNVNQQDFTFWKSRFGANSGSGASGVGAVPEPASWLLALMAVGGFAAVRRRSI